LAIERVMTPEVLHDGGSEENTEIFSLENQAKRLNVIYQQASEALDKR
jgi:hypothetical protein